MKIHYILLTAFLAISSLTFISLANDKIHLSGKSSPYSEKLAAFFEDKKYTACRIEDQPSVVCISTQNDPLYIGLEQSFIIHAPADKVIAIIDDFNHYPDLFKDIVKAEIIKKESSSNFILRQELRMPIPFLPHLVFDMSYFTSGNSENKRYIYKLFSGNDMKFNDGMINIAQRNNLSCSFYALDFIYGNWSALGKLSNTIIWEEVVKNNVEANLLVKVKAEHPGWDLKKITKEVKRINESVNYSALIKKKTTSDSFFLKRN